MKKQNLPGRVKAAVRARELRHNDELARLIHRLKIEVQRLQDKMEFNNWLLFRDKKRGAE